MDVNADVCRKLYNYLCEIIGSEDVVKVRRQYYASLDYFCERETAFVSSGSRSEGLDMGSDLDIMGLLTFIHISQKRSADSFLIPNNFSMETESCKPGFTQLKGHSCYYHPVVHMMCAPRNEEYVFASGDVRLWMLSIVNLIMGSLATLHGPCISDSIEDGTIDFALCLRCPEWIKQAQPWLKRERYWPSPKNSKTLSHFYSGLFVHTNKSKTERICCEINTISTTLNTSAQLRVFGMLSFLPIKVMNHNLYDASCQFYGRHIIRRFLDIKSDRFIPSIVFCRFCQIFGKTFDIHIDLPNRYKYSLSKRYLPYFYLGVHADAVSGWLYLATCFYGFCQYKIALQLILHASVNCSDNKLFMNSIKLYSSNLDDIEKEGIFSGVWNRLNVYRRHVIDEISFYLNSKVNPQELKVQNTTQSYICPNVYLYFLRFLCLYRLNDSSIHHTSTQALLDIRAACQDAHFNSNDYSIADTSECLAVALSICGCQEQAKIVFSYIKELNKTFKRFSFDPKLFFFLIDKLHKMSGIEIFDNESIFI
ncbi:unnamed protein product [Mytilus coruscus]|uniref:Mab-21-like HhH/H2TH-like domain-containing protein n=1 Tax=Mytilus coruscus TaxID=42192 RepID=A0A6J8DSC2_MYTCO|nr:unnamed protein product [Mytilus coruscus]